MTGNPHINILSSNYSRYGTSVYQTLYSADGRGSTENSRHDATGGSNSDDNSIRMDSDNTKSKFKRKYKSLIQNYSGNSPFRAKKFIGKFHDHSSSESFSIFSLRSSYSNRNLPTAHSRTALASSGGQHNAIFEDYRPYDDINELPMEIMAMVIEQFTQGACFEDSRTLVRCLYVNKKLYEATKTELYKAPTFTSTYRFAQFVTTLRLHPQNGLLVRQLDLSMLKNGLIEEGCKSKADKHCRSGDERIPARRRTSARDILEEADEDETEDMEEDSGVADPERALTPIEDDLPDIALAGWRDWRYRFDPLYGNQMLTCNNAMRKVNSRPSSINSNGTGSTGIGPGCRRSHRSNSSVTSFTTTIMSSFYNSPSLSSISLTSSYDNAKGAATGKWFNKLFSSKKSAKQQYERFVEAKFKNANNIDEVCADGTQDKANNRTSVKFSVQTSLKDQPFHERHPMTNKFLLKYALSKDIPLGYLFHVVKLCPNITALNLADLSISTDFRLHTKKDSNWNHATSLLPDVQVTTSDADALVGRNLESVYFTDSSKGHGSYENTGGILSKKLDDLHFVSPYTMLGESWISSNYPPPIDRRTKIRGQRTLNQRQHNYSLSKLEVRQLLELIHDRLTDLSRLNMDNVVWCNQPDVKGFVFSSLEHNPDLHVSFLHAGMGRNLSWASSGHVRQFAAIVLLGEILDRDDLYLEDLFNVRTERFNCDTNHDYSLLGRSNKLAARTYGNKIINCKLQVGRGSLLQLETSADLESTIVCDISLGARPVPCDAGMARIEDLAHNLIGRLEGLRMAELRRHIGENQYTIH
ncbi:LANO_0E09208g1_1 [Lachancea nothofagi CBS 11611]|uniref:LANO_0E09208g1_1 n=1 Tax=Lachancea nothofagi CBS 11611 TaxID=1266666 RepID=A0A1G4JVT3_9SACH|nr:LANO_0E09208g1_1 [Lachancea nothofagi CBS 11611]